MALAVEIISKKEVPGGHLLAIKDGPAVCRVIIGVGNGSMDCKMETDESFQKEEMSFEISYSPFIKDKLLRQKIAGRICYTLTGVNKSAISCL